MFPNTAGNYIGTAGLTVTLRKDAARPQVSCQSKTELV